MAPALALLVLAACSGDPTGPALPSSLVGTWTAEEMIVQSVDDPEVGGDLIEAGAVFVLEIHADGSYLATLTLNELPPAEQPGRIEVEGSTLTLDPEGGDPPREGTWSLSGGRLVIDGETAFDFDQNGTLESAYLHLELVGG